MASTSKLIAAHSRRFEWVSLIYLIFFVLAVATPSIVSNGIFGFSEQSLEEFLIFIFGLAGLMTFATYQRLMERRMEEREAELTNADRILKELQESYRYIGSMNRHIDVLKTLVNKTSMSLVDADAYWKDLLQSIAANAASCADAGRVLIRFVELEKLRTEKEVFFSVKDKKPLRIANKDLRTLHEHGASHAFTRSEDSDEMLVVPSDRKDSPVKAYLLLATDPSRVEDAEVSLLKVFANQAELVYHTLKQRGAEAGTPLDKVEDVTSMAVGDVG